MFGLLSGQPLTMLGLTGPDLVFESLVITFLSCRVLMLKITKWSSTVRRKPFFFQAKKEALSAIFLPSKKGSFISHFSSKQKRKLYQPFFFQGKKEALSGWYFRFISSAWALAGNTCPFASGLDSGLLPCSSYSSPRTPGEHFLVDFWLILDVSLQLLCLLHHTIHGGMLRLPDRHHLHHQGGAEHDQDWLQLPHQPESLPLPSWKLHWSHVRRFWLDLTFPCQRLVECTGRLV